MTQAASHADILLEITAQRRRRVAGEIEPLHAPGGAALQGAGRNAFCAALEAARGNAIIAEIKMGSPKLGSLVGTFDPEAQAKIYAEHGAAALSVVVEPDFFFGSYELLERCKTVSGLPAIAKDFIVSSRQLEAARDAGADAVLLIAALLSADELAGYADQARHLGLVPLVETHCDEDVDKLGQAAWELVGVNNRDLRTFAVDLESSIRLLPRLPSSALKVGESGIRTRRDIARLAAAGFDAFLIGETLLKAADPAVELRRLLGREPEEDR